MIDQQEALQILKTALSETNRPDSDYLIRRSPEGHFWVVRPRSYEDYGVGLGHWLLHSETGKLHAVNGYVDPDTWEQIYLDNLDPTKTWALRYDSTDSTGLLKLKKLFDISLSEAKRMAGLPCWLAGHRVKLQSAQALLQEKGVRTTIERVENSEELRRTPDFPHDFHDTHQLLTELEGL